MSSVVLGVCEAHAADGLLERAIAQTILRYGAIPAFLRPMPFQKIRNLGGKLGTAVKETYEANTVGDLLYVRA